MWTKKIKNIIYQKNQNRTLIILLMINTKKIEIQKNERITENLKKINILVEIATMIGTKIIDIIYMIKIKIIIVKKIIKKFMFKARFK